jgi:hypothetical protein
MFARILEFVPRLEKKDELVRVVKNEILPIMKKQHGFLEILPFVPEVKHQEVLAISLWMDRKDAERYEKDWFVKVEEILKPYLASPITFRRYMVETTLCEHFERAMVA